METIYVETESLEKVRALEHQRIKATGKNDVEALAPLLDDELIYVNSMGEIYDKQQYLRAIGTHGLTYVSDFDVRETHNRVMDRLVILAGVMLGHSRLDGERQVFRYPCLSVWREQGGDWRMVAWQSSSSSTKSL